MKYVLFALLLLVVACGAEEIETPENLELDSDSMKADTNEDGDMDIEVTPTEEGVEVTLDMDELLDEETKEAIADVPAEAFCVPGETFEYAGEEGTTESEIIGLTQYKGSERCQAESITTIESPMGTITAETTYYFDNTYTDFWILTTTSGPMPAQTNEIHLVDGEVQ